MILLPLNERAESSPNVPVFLPLYVAPRLSAASSISGTACFSQIACISSILAGVPYRCTTTTALGFGCFSKAASSASGSMFHVSCSLSMNTGMPPS